MRVSDGQRYFVSARNTADSTDASETEFAIKELDGGTASASGAGEKYIVLGNLYAQGTNQPESYMEPELIKRVNPFMIMKERYKVNGSQATNIGWVNIGNGDYRWYMKGEQETRARFEDKRENDVVVRFKGRLVWRRSH